jgi:enediyne biosynthesis protein E4
MLSCILRFALMAAILGAGYFWVRPGAGDPPPAEIRFEEQAEAAGCFHRHTMCQLSPKFQNIMPWLTSVGAAVAAADYDNSGYASLYVIDSGPHQKNHLFHNCGDGTFEDVTDQAGVGCQNEEGACMHAIWGDIDNDGLLDLYVVKWGAPNQLFHNDGNGHFTDISKKAGVDYWGYGNAATFLDYDRDGHLDLLLGNYFPETVEDPKTGKRVRNDLWNPVSTKVMQETFTHARNGGHNVLYRNRGDGTFEDVTEKVGLAGGGWSLAVGANGQRDVPVQKPGLAGGGWTLAVGAGDLNNDGWPDLYIANDFGPDEYYLNTGATESPPRFRLVRDPSGHPGIGADWWKGMNVDMADVNNDGYLDIYVTNILSHKYKTDEGNMLWLNCEDATMPGGRNFHNMAEACGVMDGGWGWGGKFADFNNDGLLDIFTVNGFVTGSPDRNYWYQIQEMVTQTKNQTVDAADWPVMGDRDLSGYEPSKLFIQMPPSKPGDMPKFVDCAQQAGITDLYNGRGIAIADFNHSGLLSMYVANQGAPCCYYVNKTKLPPGVSFLRIKLIGKPELGTKVAGRTLASTRDAVGGRVILHTKSGLQMREVQGGMGYASQSEYALHFGVPVPAAIEKIEVKWPSSRRQEVTGEAARSLIGHHVEWTEGEAPVVVDHRPAAGGKKK